MPELPRPHPNNPLVCKVAMLYARDTRRFVNTFHLKRPTGWSFANMIDAAAATANWWAGFLRACVPSVVALDQVQVRQYNPAAPLAYDLPIAPAVPGTRAGGPEAANVTLTLSLRTGLAGRAYRGRIYLPSLSETDVTVGDTVTSPLAALVASAGANFVSGAWPTGTFPVIFHRPDILPKPLDNTYTDVVSFVVDAIVDSQRRRLPGRGR